MDFTSALSALFSYQFVLFALSMNIFTWILRTITEYIFPQIVNVRAYQKLFLPLASTILGAVVGMFAIKYAYPDGLNTRIDRVLFGLVAGNFGATIYQVAKGMLKDKMQQLKQNSQSNQNDGNKQP
jgi:hypothetical protein